MANLKKLKAVVTFMIVIVLILALEVTASAVPLGKQINNATVDSLVPEGLSSYRISVNNSDISSHKYTLSYEILPSHFKADFFLKIK